MTKYDYNLNIPAGPDNPSNDRPLMTTNTNSTSAIIDEDHIGFQQNNGGLHKKTRILVDTGVPSGTAGGMGTLYTKTSATSASTNESTLFYVPDATTNQYQLTRTISPNFSSFATNNSYSSISPVFPPSGFTAEGGWTFLPGGLILQYGLFGKTTSLGQTGTVQFLFPFTTAVFSVSLTLVRTNPDGNPHDVYLTSTPTTTNFSFRSNTEGNGFIYWMAIGV